MFRSRQPLAISSVGISSVRKLVKSSSGMLELKLVDLCSVKLPPSVNYDLGNVIASGNLAKMQRVNNILLDNPHFEQTNSEQTNCEQTNSEQTNSEQTNSK